MKGRALDHSFFFAHDGSVARFLLLWRKPQP